MTLPFERKNSLNYTRDFLIELLDPKSTPKVPSKIRRWARSCLRHYPMIYEIDQLSKKCPEILGDFESEQKIKSAKS